MILLGVCMYALTNCKIYTGLDILNKHAILIDNDRIIDICLESELPEGVDVQNLQGVFIAPGFIDIQLNGCGGVQFNETLEALSIETLELMQQTNLKSGCTSYLPTLITSTDEFMIKAISVMRKYKKRNENQALGLHLEGPYISPKKQGIHNAELIRKPDQKMIDFLCKNSDVIHLVTLAPEQVENSMIQQLTDAGIKVSMGHTNASYDEATQGVRSGVRLATHLFNAMTTIEGRKPNVVGAVYDSPEVYCGIIADGYHVHWANIRNSWRIKQDKLVLVTDASLPAGTDITECTFAGKTIYHKEGKCLDEHGTLAGSALTMIEAVKNVVQEVGIPLDEALRMASLYPAKAIGVNNELGLIAPGKIANLVIFNDDFKIIATILNGNIYLN